MSAPSFSFTWAVAVKNSSHEVGIGTPAFSKVVALKKNTRPVVETGRPCSTPTIEPEARSASVHWLRSIAGSVRRSAKPVPFFENSGSQGQLTWMMSASVPPAIWVVSFSR